MEYVIGKTLRELRKEAGFTQKQVAKLMDKSETGYASWEQGLSEPSVNDLRRLCRIYEISADILLGLDEDC
ncbi:MAG: helix-turn-helix transcriptional regulator [Clostridia bacterium]|nr:helix-turn-helix transcriptional regulator [Clostridia bacterium]